MTTEEILWNILLMIICYVYISLVIFLSSRMDRLLHVSKKTSRKFLHIMIGNLPFVIPFFTVGVFPVLVAAPFILVTLITSPYNPLGNAGRKLKGLSGISEEGHPLGLVFYAISYTFLALFFSPKAYVIAAGILPMAYGDSIASLIGERFGRKKYKLTAKKSVEGSIAMLLVSFLSLAGSLFFFSSLYSFSAFDKLAPAFIAVSVATLAEGLSPLGFDNLTVPASSVLSFLLVGGGS